MERIYLTLGLAALFTSLAQAAPMDKGPSPEPNEGAYYLERRGEGKKDLEKLPAMNYGEKCALSGCTFLPTPGPHVPRAHGGPNPYDGYRVITPPQHSQQIIIVR